MAGATTPLNQAMKIWGLNSLCVRRVCVVQNMAYLQPAISPSRLLKVPASEALARTVHIALKCHLPSVGICWKVRA